jgi:hypothetical protein
LRVSQTIGEKSKYQQEEKNSSKKLRYKVQRKLCTSESLCYVHLCINQSCNQREVFYKTAVITIEVVNHNHDGKMSGMWSRASINYADGYICDFFKTSEFHGRSEKCPKCGSVSIHKKSDYFFL